MLLNSTTFPLPFFLLGTSIPHLQQWRGVEPHQVMYTSMMPLTFFRIIASYSYRDDDFFFPTRFFRCEALSDARDAINSSSWSDYLHENKQCTFRKRRGQRTDHHHLGAVSYKWETQRTQQAPR